MPGSGISHWSIIERITVTGSVRGLFLTLDNACKKCGFSTLLNDVYFSKIYFIPSLSLLHAAYPLSLSAFVLSLISDYIRINVSID